MAISVADEPVLFITRMNINKSQQSVRKQSKFNYLRVPVRNNSRQTSLKDKFESLKR